MKERRGEAGSSMVEFAFSAVVFFTLVLFILDGSRIMWHYVTVADAARVGARYASTHGANSTAPVGPSGYTALSNVVRNQATGLDAANLTVTATWAQNNQPGSIVTVDIAYRTQTLTSMFWAGQTFTLRSRSSMVIQN